MNIIKLLEVLSSENKLKIIIHYLTCECDDSLCVNELQEELKLTQSNLSKHLTSLKQLGILDVKTAEKKRIYSLDKNFKKEYFYLLNSLLKNKDIAKYQCKHCIKKI